MRTPPVILAIDAFLEYVSATPSWEASSHRRGTGTFTIHIQEFECSMKIGRIYLMELRYGVQVCPAMCTLSAGSNLTQRTGSPEKIDLVVTLGGDGTILHASSLFSAGAVPPVLSFSMGTLGFLLPFRSYPIQRKDHISPHSFGFTQILMTLTKLWKVYFPEKLPFSIGCVWHVHFMIKNWRKRARTVMVRIALFLILISFLSSAQIGKS